MMTVKIFISHAKKDKATIALPLYTQLRTHNLNPWIDKKDIEHSSSLFHAINKGLAESLYAVVIISPSFINSNWTNKELEAIHNRYVEKRISHLFVIYHEIERSSVVDIYPLLSDNLAFDSQDGVDYIAKRIRSSIETKDELREFVKAKQEGREYVVSNENELPRLDESFYFMMNLQHGMERVEEPFLAETIKRLTSIEKEKMIQLLVKDLIQNDESYARLYEDVVRRIPHRGRDEEVFVDLNLIGDDVLVSLLEG